MWGLARKPLGTPYRKQRVASSDQLDGGPGTGQEKPANCTIIGRRFVTTFVMSTDARTPGSGACEGTGSCTFEAAAPKKDQTKLIRYSYHEPSCCFKGQWRRGGRNSALAHIWTTWRYPRTNSASSASPEISADFLQGA
ncbi:hypothetical protein N7533_005584 [Penicillium manginii]|jgi:hypothetical protein|uniref:uncharacterized protein n=1 Tax=Penicillium manginii TaxID=203109 RepID=UPI0025471A65|nr:uncharacterized protein N7533_005584 [Penicillium manginii]KAJ5756041.1 hypothetical protein N7533_005584 [Penicillium manginii]